MSVCVGNGDGSVAPPPIANYSRRTYQPRPPPPPDHTKYNDHRSNSIDSVTAFLGLKSLFPGKTDEELEGKLRFGSKTMVHKWGMSPETGAELALPFVLPKFLKKNSSKENTGEGDQFMKPSKFPKSLNDHPHTSTPIARNYSETDGNISLPFSPESNLPTIPQEDDKSNYVAQVLIHAPPPPPLPPPPPTTPSGHHRLYRTAAAPKEGKSLGKIIFVPYHSKTGRKK